MRYVAFLDILGFKEKIKTMSQIEAKEYIGAFSLTVYSVFHVYDHSDKLNDLLDGFVVSDSMILYTKDVAIKSLKELIKIVDEICKREFCENGIVIRGAIAKGEFDRMPAVELSNLKKQLIVGQAYVDAFKLESKLKNIGITLSETVYEDFQNCDLEINTIEEIIDNKSYYILRYLTVDYLMDKDNLKQFVKLANESEWLPHYYNAIYFALKLENSEKKINQFFLNIFDQVCDHKPGENWRRLDTFIKNAFAEQVIDSYKTRFLKYLRQKLQTDNANIKA